MNAGTLAVPKTCFAMQRRRPKSESVPTCFRADKGSGRGGESLKTICWGILGTGAMAEQFAGALLTLPDAALGGTASRTRGQARQFATRFGVSRSFESVSDLLADPAVDIVYIATRNEFHQQDALAALHAGKAVLCEKPFALDAAQGRVVVETARRLGLFCMEAMWMRFSPGVRELRDIVRSGRIGSLQSIQAHFGVSIPLDRDHRVYAKRGGGALYDLGVYPVSLTQLLLGKPKTVRSRSWVGATGVDEHFTASLQYESGGEARIGASLLAQLSNSAQVYGTEGRADLIGGIYFPDGCEIEMDGGGMGAKVRSQIARWIPRKHPPRWKQHSLREGYAIEAEAVQRCVRAGDKECAEMPLNDTIEVLETMDVIRNQWARNDQK
jgi:predicted dehydrogenase